MTLLTSDINKSTSRQKKLIFVNVTRAHTFQCLSTLIGISHYLIKLKKTVNISFDKKNSDGHRLKYVI